MLVRKFGSDEQENEMFSGILQQFQNCTNLLKVSSNKSG